MNKIRQAINLTDKAAHRIKALIADSPDERRLLKLGIEKAGCVGQAYHMDYIRDPDPLDEIVEDKGVRIAIEPKALMFLLGMEMDYEENIFKAGFVFNNPNQIDQCGCGESVMLAPSELVLEKTN